MDMPIERDHLYVIPPGTYLSVAGRRAAPLGPAARVTVRACRSTSSCTRLAEEYGARAICVILSGTGADGSLGLKAVQGERRARHRAGSDEAAYDGMPRNAIMTGVGGSRCCRWRRFPTRCRNSRRGLRSSDGRAGAAPSPPPDNLPEIIDLLRTRTAHDFTLYKPGTLQRRIERRMAMAGFGATG